MLNLRTFGVGVTLIFLFPLISTSAKTCQSNPTNPTVCQILLDATDITDWVRVNNPSWWKYKDSALLPNSLIKFDISDLPEDAEIIDAQLRYYLLDNHWPFTPINISYCIVSDWSSDSSLPTVLYNWMCDLPIGTDSLSATGWREFDITTALIIQQYVGDPLFTVKLHGYPPTQRFASPSSVDADLQPQILVHYWSTTATPDLVTFPSWINLSIEPLGGDSACASLKAKVRNNGSSVAQNIAVQCYINNIPFGSLQTIPAVAPGNSAEVVIERISTHPVPTEAEIMVSVDPSNTIPELDETNNVATLLFQIPRSSYRESFETSFGDWQTDYDAPANDTIGPRACTFTRVQGQAKEGTYAVRMTINGQSDDGTLWLFKAIPVFPEHEYEIRLSFWHYRETDPHYVNTSYHVVGFVGNYPAETEQDFEILDGLDCGNNTNPGQGTQYPRWENYTLTKTLPSGSMQYLWVGFGLTAVYECWISKLFDYVSVEVTRIEP